MAVVKPQFTSWSYSRFSDYTQCPQRASYKHLLKLPEGPPSPAMARGAEIDKAGEDYIKGVTAKLRPELNTFKADFAAARKLYANRVKLGARGMAPVVQETWAFRRDWSRTVFNDWNGCALRIKVDLATWSTDTQLDITDWKTGKFKPEMNEKYLEQLELYALGAFMWFDHLETVTARLAYTDLGITFPHQEPLAWTRAGDLRALKAKWEKRVKPMLADKRFAPRPSNDACRFCAYSKSKGGPCKF